MNPNLNHHQDATRYPAARARPLPHDPVLPAPCCLDRELQPHLGRRQVQRHDRPDSWDNGSAVQVVPRRRVANRDHRESTTTYSSISLTSQKGRSFDYLDLLSSNSLPYRKEDSGAYHRFHHHTLAGIMWLPTRFLAHHDERPRRLPRRG